MKNSRREFFKLAGMAGVGMVGGSIVPAHNAGAVPQPTLIEPESASSFEPLNRSPRMMQGYFVERVRQIEQKATKRRSGLRTKSDAEAYVHEVRRKVQQSFGPWPEKTPLNARVTGILERDAYNIEKVIFDSRLGFPVTANLYVPKGRKFPLPAIVGACGHRYLGKASVPSQSFSQGLARQGYVVLIFDPIGQGERIQYPTSELKSRFGSTGEHLYAGNQMFLPGESISTWFAWDGIRALDYLLTRPEVDPKHVGITGNSGGGVQTTWLCAVEPRFSMAAPCCFVSTFRHNLENEEVADTEQCPRRVLSMGLDHSDFIAAFAPKPVILLSQEKDFFDVRGAEESFARLKHLYKLLGAEQNIQLFIGPGYHGYRKLNREAMYGWFNKATKTSNQHSEPSLTLEKKELLWCTPHGQTRESNTRTVFSFTSQLSGELKKKRRSLQGDELKKAVISALNLPPHEGVPCFRILRSKGPERHYPKKFSCTYMVETEPNISTFVYRLADERLLARPPIGLKRALLYVSHQSADNELRKEELLTELVQSEPSSAVFACDVRGIGESQPNTTRKTFLEPYGSDYFYAIHSIMLDCPYVGQKTYDVLRMINWLRSFDHKEIHLVGKGWGALPATFAAMLSSAVTQITLKNALTSYSDIAEHEGYSWPLSTLLPGVLKTFDLPDCYRSLASKGLRQIDPWGAEYDGG